MEEVLVMFSGGKDSMLSSCMLTPDYDTVNLISFNNGCISHEEIFRHGAQRLIVRFKPKVQWVGIRTTYAEFRRYCGILYNLKISDISLNCPDLTICQFNCMCCQTAMWVNAIAYCLANNISTIASGYKQTDEFCTGSKKYWNVISEFANDFGIKTVFPVCDILNVDRQLEMWSILPSVYEPKCCLGCPTSVEFRGETERQLLSILSNTILPIARDDVQKLRSIFAYVKVTDESLEAINCNIPGGKEGWY
ncbi:MAG: hypothetical protein NC548_10635 [Lachnospiraceae bacterium]|nr:hypothetical protein [Lachnospiraceae bacterium]